MSALKEKGEVQISTNAIGEIPQHKRSASGNHAMLDSLHQVDNSMLAELGYKAVFKREFSVCLQYTYLASRTNMYFCS